MGLLDSQREWQRFAFSEVFLFSLWVTRCVECVLEWFCWFEVGSYVETNSLLNLSPLWILVSKKVASEKIFQL